jgi:hypothetical protein
MTERKGRSPDVVSARERPYQPPDANQEDG